MKHKNQVGIILCDRKEGACVMVPNPKLCIQCEFVGIERSD